MYSPDPEGREGLIFICYLEFQKKLWEVESLIVWEWAKES